MITLDEIRAAIQGTPCGSLEDTERRTVLRQTVERTYALRNYEPAADELDDTLAELDGKVCAAYRHLTPAEIRLALEAGIVGDYGGDKRPNAANILGWVSTYASGELRRSAIASALKAWTPKQDEPLSFIERQRRNEAAGRNGALRLFNEVLTTGTFDVTVSGYAAMVYDYLAGNGKIHPLPETVRAAFQEAKDHPRRTLDFDAAIASPADLMDYQTKAVLLRRYFKSLIARNVTSLAL